MDQTIVKVNCTNYELEAARKKMKSSLMQYGVDIDKYETQLQLVQKFKLIKNGKLSLKFDLNDKSKDYNSETGIVNNDVFIPVGIALGFLKTPLIAGTTDFEAIENQQIIYFNSDTIFAYTNGTAVSQAKALESLYYSQISFNTSNDIAVAEFPARELRRVPQGKVDGHYYYQNGKYFMFTEFPFLNGGNNNEVKFDVPSADTASASGDTATEETYAALQLIGFNITDLAKDYTNLGCQIKCVK